MNDKCRILVPFEDGLWTTRDVNGCIKPEGHNSAHISLLEDGRYIQWEDDYSCNCGCWDEGDFDNVCRVARFLTEEEVNEILTNPATRGEMKEK